MGGGVPRPNIELFLSFFNFYSTFFHSRYCIVFFYKTLGFGLPNQEYWKMMCEDGFDVESAIGKKLGKR